MRLTVNSQFVQYSLSKLTETVFDDYSSNWSSSDSEQLEEIRDAVEDALNEAEWWRQSGLVIAFLNQTVEIEQIDRMSLRFDVFIRLTESVNRKQANDIQKH